MTKAHLLQVLVIDHDHLGVDEVERVLEDANYPNDSIRPNVIKSQSVEIGDWDDNNLLNYSDTQAAEVDRLFSAWQPIETAPKDGTHILLFYQGNFYSGWYEKSEEFTFVDKQGKKHTNYSYWHIDSPDNNCWYDIEDEVPEYCYWMPLPNPPLG